MFLSSGDAYRGIDILATMKAAWERRSHTKAPDFGEVGGDYAPSKIVFERNSAGQMLDITVLAQLSPTKPQPTYRFRIPESQFKPYSLPH